MTTPEEYDAAVAARYEEGEEEFLSRIEAEPHHVDVGMWSDDVVRLLRMADSKADIGRLAAMPLHRIACTPESVLVMIGRARVRIAARSLH